MYFEQAISRINNIDWNNFKISVNELQWIDGAKDNSNDLCLHGYMIVTIGGRVLEMEGMVTVSASALYFLKTLTENHIINEDNQMMPCCGHMIIPNEDGKTVTISGCNQGIDWTVLHEGDSVKIILEDGSETIVTLEEYRAEIFAFADEIEGYYNTCTPKKPEDEWERDAYNLFWEEWHRRRGNNL